MAVVIADTGPINYLLRIGNIDILSQLFGTIRVADAVIAELLHPRAPPIVREWVSDPPDWLMTMPAGPIAPTFFPALGSGERATIVLAEDISADLVLMDDRAGVLAALSCGINVIGTLGVLDVAADADLIDFPAAISRLKETNFRVRPELLDQLLRDRS